jgi:hypothetical protein
VARARALLSAHIIKRADSGARRGLPSTRRRSRTARRRSFRPAAAAPAAAVRARPVTALIPATGPRPRARVGTIVIGVTALGAAAALAGTTTRAVRCPIAGIAAPRATLLLAEHVAVAARRG